MTKLNEISGIKKMIILNLIVRNRVFLVILIIMLSNEFVIAGSLHDAIKDGNVETIKALLSKGSNVNEKDNEGKTPLIYAARFGLKNVAEFLLAGGAKIDLRGNSGASPLWYAASAGHKEVVELLLAKGANIQLMDNDGYTPLHEAAGEGIQMSFIFFCRMALM